MQNHIDARIAKSALAKFLLETTVPGTEVHSLIIRQNNQELLRWQIAPYTCDDKRELYSLSKSFTSTAMGVAYDRGLVRPEDLVLDLFPEYRELGRQDERWARMQLRHVMTMSTGHAACVFPQMAFGEDSVRAFFETPLAWEPGEMFIYNTGATCLMAEVVRRVTGLTVPQLLSQTLFDALGIEGAEWKACSDGHCQGGTGLALSCDDLAKFGQLYLDRGVWNGRRVLSEAWCDLATSFQMNNERNGNPDWTNGYGFQFWRNRHKGYRGDGAFGQLCVVIPEKQLVLAMGQETDDMHKQFELLWPWLEKLCEAVDEAQEPLSAYEAPASPIRPGYDSGWRTMEKNGAGLHALRLCTDDAGVKLQWSDELSLQTIRAPWHGWQTNSLYASGLMPNLHDMMPRTVRQELRFSAAAFTDGERICLDVRMRNAPHHFVMAFGEKAGRLHMQLETSHDVFAQEKQICEKA